MTSTAPVIRSRTALETPTAGARKHEYSRPDICLLHSMRAASDKIRDELKEIGDEGRYQTALRVMKTQAQLLGTLAEELLQRFDRRGIGDEQ